MADPGALEGFVEAADLARLKALRQRFEIAAGEAAALAAEAEQVACRLRNRAQWLSLEEEHRRRRRELRDAGA